MLDFTSENIDNAFMYEMYFSKELDPVALCDAISKHLFVRREGVAVVPITHIDTKETAVVIEDIGGDYPFGVTVHADMIWLPTSEAELAQKLCRSLQVECLISDDGANPYSWLHITQNSVQNVLVNPELFDGQCILQIESVSQGI